MYVTQLSIYKTHSIYKCKELLGDGLSSSVRTEYIINCKIEKVSKYCHPYLELDTSVALIFVSLAARHLCPLYDVRDLIFFYKGRKLYRSLRQATACPLRNCNGILSILLPKEKASD